MEDFTDRSREIRVGGAKRNRKAFQVRNRTHRSRWPPSWRGRAPKRNPTARRRRRAVLTPMPTPETPETPPPPPPTSTTRTTGRRRAATPQPAPNCNEMIRSQFNLKKKRLTTKVITTKLPLQCYRKTKQNCNVKESERKRNMGKHQRTSRRGR